jgi:UDP-glucose 4-epimerase
MKILITGVAGFIGSHLLEKLLGLNFQISGIDNLSVGKLSNIKKHLSDPNFKFVEGDIRNKQLIEELTRDVDVIVHLAALADIVPSVENPEEYFTTNVVGTFNIINSAKINQVHRIVYAASSSCYGIPDSYPTTEDAAIDTRYPYALTKFVGELIILHWCNIYNISGISLRLFNVYGLRSRTSGTYGAVFGVFLAQKRAGKPLTIVGDGNQMRDFTNVKDVVEAIYLAIFSTKEGIFNVGTGIPVAVNRIAELIGGNKVFIKKRPGEPDKTHADATKINKELGWKSQISIEEGIQEMISNIDDWKGSPIWDVNSIEMVTQNWFKYIK